MNAGYKQTAADCVELLSRFQETQSVRFQIFSQIWREMKFSEIFYGIQSCARKRAFSRLVLNIAYTFFMPPYSFHIRVGGLYMLYSLYHCQTTSPREQIRLALKDWDELKKFENNAVNAQHFDTVYILKRLMFQKAFVFTAMPTLLLFKKKRKVESSVLCEEFVERPCRPQELINVDLLEELSNIDEHYRKLKTSFLPSLETDVFSVNVIQKDLTSQLRGTVVDFYQWQQMKAGTEGEEDSGEGTSSQQECSRRAMQLASIKSKAYGEAAEASKSRRHRQVEVDITSNKAGPSHRSHAVRINKPSLKTRTHMNALISGDTWKDVTEASEIHCLTSLDFDKEELKRPKI